VGITVAFAPPDLPVYEQPVCPGEGYFWTPGYWAWDEDNEDYYWVPGTWVLLPEVGFLWTPGYWAWGGSGFIFYEGYWSFELVGFYGGINYGYGYFGYGYEGGRWEGDRFLYNRAVTNVNVTIIHNVYEAPVNRPNTPRVSYNGGNGGIIARPTSQEEAAARARHISPLAIQKQHVQMARSNPQLRASVNHGKPPVAATPKPAAFNESGVVPAREAGVIHRPSPGTAHAENNEPRRTTAEHPNELPPLERPAPPNTGNPNLDRKYQKQQEKLFAQQEKERQKLQQQEEWEHQELSRQSADEARRQQLEQRHQQQTEQMVQRHFQQQQQLQERQQHSAPPREKH
jgi:hypothetical protein